MWVPPKYRRERDHQDQTQPIPLELPLQPYFPPIEKRNERPKEEKQERGVYIIEM